MSFRLAKQVQEVADRLIEEHHARLHGVTVTAVFLDKIPTSKGRQVWARAKKIGGLNAFLVFAESVRGLRGLTEAHEYGDQPHDLFVLEIAEDAWNKLTDTARKALVDEQLCSMEIEEDEETGSVSLAVVGPDVVAWRDATRRNGLWREDLEEFVRAGAEQLTLLEPDAPGLVGEGEEEGDRFSPEVMREARKLHEMGAEMTVLDGGRSS